MYKKTVGMVSGFCLLSLPVLLRCGLLQTDRGMMLKNCSSLQVVNASEVVAKLDENYSYDGCVYALKEDALEAELTECKDKDVTKMEIPEFVDKNGKQYSLTSIGEYAFHGCSNLRTIELPNSLTSIDYCAFNGCKSLKSITLPISLKSIDTAAFIGCESLETITIPEGVEHIYSETFAGCESLETITLPTSLKVIGDMAFVGCKNLKSITLPKGVEDICLTAINSCIGLEEIKVDEGNRNYKSKDGVLFSKDGKKLILYPVGKVRNNYAIPQGVESIGSGAIICESLKSIKLPTSLKVIGDMAFGCCDKLEEIKVDEENINYKSKDGVLFSKDGKKLIQYPAGKKESSYKIPEGVENISNMAIRCESLESITLPTSLTSIGEYAFHGCKSLKSITIPEGVESICDEVFSGCESLESITLPTSLKSICSGAFRYCESLETITLPQNVKSIDAFVFDSCIKLKEITVDERNINYKSKDGVLFSKDGKKLIQYPAGKKESSYRIPEGVESIDHCAFDGCRNFKLITIPKSLKSIDREPFSGCKNLEKVNVDTKNQYYKSIDNVLFSKDCTQLILYPRGRKKDRYVIPEGVESICYKAFNDCKSLDSIMLPESVKSIGEYAFMGCKKLESVTIKSKILKSIDKNAFKYYDYDVGQYKPLSQNITFYVPPGMVDKYKEMMKNELPGCTWPSNWKIEEILE